MHRSIQHRLHRIRRRLRAVSFLLFAAVVLTASIATPQISAAAEINLSGIGTFKAPSAEQLAALPTDLGFSQSDLASGTWSFSVRYEDSSPGSEPSAYVARYAGAIHSFRLVIGKTTLDLPIDQAVISVSDGGDGFPNRESIRVETKALMPSGLLHLSWVQVNQQPKGSDLRGPAGTLPTAAMPASSTIANMATENPFDRFLELRIDRPNGDPRPLLYLSSSKLTVTAGTATVP